MFPCLGIVTLAVSPEETPKADSPPLSPSQSAACCSITPRSYIFRQIGHGNSGYQQKERTERSYRVLQHRWLRLWFDKPAGRKRVVQGMDLAPLLDCLLSNQSHWRRKINKPLSPWSDTCTAMKPNLFFGLSVGIAVCFAPLFCLFPRVEAAWNGGIEESDE